MSEKTLKESPKHPRCVIVPVKKPLVIEMDGYAGGRLGEILKAESGGANSITLTHLHNMQFVRGLRAAGVMHAEKLAKFLEYSDEVRVDFEKAED
jgi:hypothetical protein